MSEDENRLVELYRSYGKLIHAYCARRTTASQAADAVSEVFVVAWRRIADVPAGDAALPWLYAVAYRVLSHQWRAGRRSQRLLTRIGGMAAIQPPEPDLVIVRREEDRLLFAAASRLRPVDQEILRLTLWEGLPHVEVASVLGIDPDAVKQRAYRARKKLAAEYQKLSKDRQPPAALRGGGS
jgi:RNA polymerase sigma-70 factor (ECF subfamily)